MLSTGQNRGTEEGQNHGWASVGGGTGNTGGVGGNGALKYLTIPYFCTRQGLRAKRQWMH